MIECSTCVFCAYQKCDRLRQLLCKNVMQRVLDITFLICLVSLTKFAPCAGPPSNYDEDGILTTELPAFSELRLIKASPNPTKSPAAPPAAPTAPPASTTAQLQDSQDDLLNTGTAAAAVVAASSHSENTAAAAISGNTVPKVGVWADLSDQIARRKAELASESDRADSDKKGADSKDSSKQQQEQQQQQEQTLEAKSVNAVPGINTPGAVRPRGGVRASAMGPMLAHLRSSGAFENTI